MKEAKAITSDWIIYDSNITSSTSTNYYSPLPLATVDLPIDLQNPSRLDPSQKLRLFACKYVYFFSFDRSTKNKCVAYWNPP